VKVDERGDEDEGFEVDDGRDGCWWPVREKKKKKIV